MNGRAFSVCVRTVEFTIYSNNWYIFVLLELIE